ncbi:hypothetical protein [Thermaerobacillus caldiproteolyticus]|nr:hypothetical protein [Anoxybacillus caldiproteolyticus]
MILDTLRFRYLLGEDFQVGAQNVYAYMIGEHRESYRLGAMLILAEDWC